MLELTDSIRPLGVYGISRWLMPITLLTAPFLGLTHLDFVGLWMKDPIPDGLSEFLMFDFYTYLGIYLVVPVILAGAFISRWRLFEQAFLVWVLLAFASAAIHVLIVILYFGDALALKQASIPDARSPLLVDIILSAVARASLIIWLPYLLLRRRFNDQVTK